MLAYCDAHKDQKEDDEHLVRIRDTAKAQAAAAEMTEEAEEGSFINKRSKRKRGKDAASGE